MAERIYSDDFVYWIKCTLALQKTKDGTAQYVENTMKSLIESFDVGEEHIGRFLKKAIVKEENKKRIRFNKERGNRTWTFNSKCKSKCQNMFRKIMDNHARKSSDKLNWNFHDPSVDYSPADYWWIIAKIYMPDHNEKSIRPDQVDPLSIFSMLLHCKLFEEVRENAEKMIMLRNALMHNATNTVSESTMKAAFAEMKAFLTHDEIRQTSSAVVDAIEKVENERFFLNNVSAENNEMMLMALELKHDALEYEIKTSPDSVESLKPFLEETIAEIVNAKQFIRERPLRAQLAETNDLLRKSSEDLDRRNIELDILETARRNALKDYEEEESKNSQLESERYELLEKMKETEQSEANKTEELKRLQEKNDHLEKELIKIIKEKEQSEANKAEELKRLQERNDRLEKKMKENVQNEAKTAEELKSLQGKNKRLKNESSEDLDRRNKELDILETARRYALKAYKEEKSKISQLESERNELLQKMEEKVQSEAKKTKELKTLQEKNDRLEKKQTEIERSKRIQLENEKRTLAEQTKIERSERIQLENEKRTLAKATDLLAQRLLAKDQECERLKRESRDMIKQLKRSKSSRPYSVQF